jgi:thiamine biosynthesis lipoprotein
MVALADVAGDEHHDLDRTETFAGRALGSVLRLTIRYGVPDPGSVDEARARAAWDAVREEFDAVDRSLSRFRADSELTALNRLAGQDAVVPVSRLLRTALAAADRAHRITGGRFDAGVLGSLERIGERGADLAAPAGGTAAVPAAAQTSLVHVPPVPIDMGGIGKGLALRWAAGRARHVLDPGDGLLLEAGGDIVAAGGAPPGGWPVGIEDPVADPAADSEPLVVMALADAAIATSSVRVRNWVGPDGRPVHHLVDPVTHEPARTGLLAVTVAWADPAWAEVWSKALFLAGRTAIGDEARARGLAAWWVDEVGRLGMSPEARVRTLWAAEDRMG